MDYGVLQFLCCNLDILRYFIFFLFIINLSRVGEGKIYKVVIESCVIR